MERRRIVIMTITAVVVIGAMALGYLWWKSRQPAATYQRFYAAAKNRDVATMKKLYSKQGLGILARTKPTEVEMDKHLSNIAENVTSYLTNDTGKERIYDNTATVQVLRVNNELTQFSFDYEDGAWKIRSMW